MFAIKIIVDNYAAYCCSYYIAANIVMAFKIVTEHRLVKEFKTEEKCMLK